MHEYDKAFYEKIDDIYEERLNGFSKRVGLIVRMCRYIEGLNEHGEIDRTKDLSPIHEATTLYADMEEFEGIIWKEIVSIEERISIAGRFTKEYDAIKNRKDDFTSKLNRLKHLEETISNAIDKLKEFEENS